MSKRIYISGKITGLDLEVVKAQFKAKEEELRHDGYNTINPITYEPYGIKNPTWQDYLRLDIKMLCDCDVIYMMSGWESSRGASFELEVAVKLGMGVVYE